MADAPLGVGDLPPRVVDSLVSGTATRGRTWRCSMTDEAGSTRSVLTPRRVVALIVLAISVIFMLQNRDSASVQLLFVEVTGPLWLTLLVSFVLGGVVTWLLMDRRRRS
jgi:uncharacterized integral membrane protein